MSPVFEACYVFLLGWLLAQVEIQAEGARGWAESLPTWRIDDPRLLRLTNGKPLTGYHLFLDLFLIALFHLPLCFTGYSPALEGDILSRYFLMAVVWYFQWFAWNPAWGVRRFLTKRIWWFPKKIARIPVEYYLGVAVSFLFAALLHRRALPRWFGLFLVLAPLNVISLAAAERITAPSRSRG